MHLFAATAVLLAAFMLRGMTGFGSGIVAIPMLALAWPLSVIVPIMAALNYVASFSLGVMDYRKTLWRELAPMLPGNLIGVVGALYLFHVLNATVLSRLLGGFILVYALYTLSGLRLRQLPRGFAAPFGVVGGAIDTLFSTGGPIFVIYFSTRRFDKGAFRATVSTLLLLETPFRIVGYLFSGLYTWTSLWLILGALPVMAVGLFLGHRIHARLSQRNFELAIGLMLLGNGLLLLFKG